MPRRRSSNLAPAGRHRGRREQSRESGWPHLCRSLRLTRARTLRSADVFFGQNIVPVVDAVGRKVSVGDEVMATPRRPRGLLSRGLRGVDY